MKKANNEWKRTSVLLTKEQWKQINRICKIEEKRKSEIIRDMIAWRLGDLKESYKSKGIRI